MKKFGFTLAEILVTLGVIGVVAALTIPPIRQEMSKSHIGPTLQKIVTTIENANMQILREAGVDDLNMVEPSLDVNRYLNLLSQHIEGSSARNFPENIVVHNMKQRKKGSWGARGFNNPVTIFSMGKSEFYTNTNRGPNSGWGAYPPRGQYLGSYLTFLVDIDGLNNGVNTWSKDIFIFVLDRNGSVIPLGSHLYDSLVRWPAAWDDPNAKDYICMPGNITRGDGCAGAIFDNNLKVLY